MLPKKVNKNYFNTKYKFNSKFLVRQQNACNISARQINSKHERKFLLLPSVKSKLDSHLLCKKDKSSAATKSNASTDRRGTHHKFNFKRDLSEGSLIPHL